ncbi:MAG: monovalent cation/H(+) antiporter subunit G [bacterium]
MTQEAIFDILSWMSCGLGALIILGGSLGLLRFPDFYTRIHAAGMTDTFGTELILLGMAFQAGSHGEVVKLFLIALFMLLTSPVATHAIGHAAFVGKLNPLIGPDLRYEDSADNKERADG